MQDDPAVGVNTFNCGEHDEYGFYQRYGFVGYPRPSGPVLVL